MYHTHDTTRLLRHEATLLTSATTTFVGSYYSVSGFPISTKTESETETGNGIRRFRLRFTFFLIPDKSGFRSTLLLKDSKVLKVCSYN